MEKSILVQLKKEKVKVPAQIPLEIPHIGRLVCYPQQYSVKHETGHWLKHLTLDELRSILPKSSQIPTLAQDNLIIAYTDSFEWIEIEPEEYGPIAFWGRLVDPETSKYERLFFRTQKFGNIELRPITDEFHYVDTQLKDLEAATQKDFEEALQQQDLDPVNYKFDNGVKATILERGEEKDRIFIADGCDILVLHRIFGTPLVAKDYDGTFPNVDLKNSRFPEDLCDLEMRISNCNSFSHLMGCYPNYIFRFHNSRDGFSIHTSGESTDQEELYVIK